MTEFKRVQWYSGGSGSGVRSWKLYGVSKVHLEDSRIDTTLRWNWPRTLCGRDIDTRPSRVLIPGKADRLCLRCEEIGERLQKEAGSPDAPLIDHGVVPKEVLDK